MASHHCYEHSIDVLTCRDVRLLGPLTALAGHHMHQHTAHGLSTIAWSCRTLDYWPPGLADRVVEAAAVHARRFRWQGLSNLVWGLMGCRCDTDACTSSNDLDVSSSSSRLAAGGSGVSPLCGPAGRQLLSLVAREAVYKLDEAQPLGLATLTQAWAAAGCAADYCS